MVIRIRDRIRNFVRLRKQKDLVKVVCLFALAGVIFLVCTVYHVWEIHQFVNTPAEYILEGDGAVSDKYINELEQNGDVSGITRQMELSVSIQYGGTETVWDCTVLSPEYMAELFGIEIPGGVSRIYMNEMAFTEFQQVISENNASVAYEEGQEMDIRYSTGEEIMDASGDGSGMGATVLNYWSAKLIVVKMGGEEAESFIYTPETEKQLIREAAGIRVRFDEHDLDGLHVGSLRKLGFEIENEEIIMAEEYELQMKLLHIRYGLVICGICIVGAVMLWRNRSCP